MEPETHYAKSGGLHIAYQVIGEGPDLVMVPGLTSHLEIQWRDPGYRRFVRSLSSFGRLVRYDKPAAAMLTGFDAAAAGWDDSRPRSAALTTRRVSDRVPVHLWRRRDRRRFVC